MMRSRLFALAFGLAALMAEASQAALVPTDLGARYPSDVQQARMCAGAGVVLCGGGAKAVPYQGSGDIYAAAGLAVPAAFSMQRRMFATYTGPLFQIELPSTATHDIGSLASNYVDLPTLIGYCGALNANGCTISKIYGQAANTATPNANTLPQATLANQCSLRLNYVSAALPTVPSAFCNTSQYLRNRASTSGIPTGNAAITDYMIAQVQNPDSSTGHLTAEFGDMEATVADTGNGHMWSDTLNRFTTNGPAGPVPGVDMENGVFGFGSIPVQPYITVLAKFRGSSLLTYQVKSSNPNNGTFTTLNDSGMPSGYTGGLALEGGLSMGEGGDGTPAPTNFFEGIVVAGASTDTTDNSVQANIVGAYPAAVNSNVSLCLSGNLFAGAMNETIGWFWTPFSVSLTPGPDPFGSNYGVTIVATATGGSANLNGPGPNAVSGNTTYTFTDYMAATTGATAFPALLALGSGSGATNAEVIVNTNTGAIIGSSGGTATVTQVGLFWKAKLVVTTPAGQTGYKPVLYGAYFNGSGSGGFNTPGLEATHYCPSLTLGSN